MRYERLLVEADNLHLIVREKKFKSRAKGLCKNNKIAINRSIKTNTEKACVLSEEIGHFLTTTGNILDQTILSNQKQERLARAWSFEHDVPLTLLAEAIDYPCQNIMELAEYLEVTEVFLLEALNYYKQKYGLYFKLGEYTIWFEPLRLIKAFE